MAVIDPDFRAFLEAQEEALKANPLPPLKDLPPALIRESYRMQRQSQDTRAPKDVQARDLKVAGSTGPAGAAK